MGSMFSPGGTEKAGDIKFHAANAIPPGWLKANGAAVSRTAYAALFAAIGTTYGAGDGATTFALPDLRGEFVRGFDDGRGVDSGRGFGSAQAGQMPQHSHSMPPLSTTSGEGVITTRESGAGGAAQSTGLQGGTSNGSENRPRNIAMLACIKY
jgi:Microcystin-dependent protein